MRTLAYKKAIELNSHQFKNKIVMDIGCGTGILSIFAAKNGAKHVYAVENAEIAYFARQIVKDNGLDKKVTVLKGKMEDIAIPVKQVNIIISEWMGYFLLFESMLDTVLWARDKYLAPNGKMLPDKCSVYVAAIQDEEYKKKRFGFWQDVYGVNMQCMKHAVMKEACVELIEGTNLISNECKVLDLDLYTCTQSDLEFSTEYSVRITQNNTVHGLVAWFDCGFENLTHPVVLTTSPYKKDTHWKQTIFYFEEEIHVKKGEQLYGSIAVRKSKANFRELDVKISYHYSKVKGEIERHEQMYKLR